MLDFASQLNVVHKITGQLWLFEVKLDRAACYMNLREREQFDLNNSTSEMLRISQAPGGDDTLPSWMEWVRDCGLLSEQSITGLKLYKSLTMCRIVGRCAPSFCEGKKSVDCHPLSVQ